MSAAEEGPLVFPLSFCLEEENCRHVWDHRQQMCGIWQLGEGPKGAALIWSVAWSWLSTIRTITPPSPSPASTSPRSLSASPALLPPPLPSQLQYHPPWGRPGSRVRRSRLPPPLSGRGTEQMAFLSPCQLLNSGNEKHIRAS